MTSRIFAASLRRALTITTSGIARPQARHFRRSQFATCNSFSSREHHNSRRFSSVTAQNEDIGSRAVPNILDENITQPSFAHQEKVDAIARDVTAASAEESGEVAANISNGTVTIGELLANTGAEYLHWFHSTVSLDGTLFPWFSSLLLSAFAIRLISLPLVYYNQIHAGRAALAAKELPRVQSFVRQSPGTLVQKYFTFRRLRSLTLRSAGTSPVKLFRWDLLVHLPIVISASMGIRQIAASRPVEWTDGGIAWFSDLTKADSTGALPILTTAFWVWNSNPRSMRGSESKSKVGDEVTQTSEDKKNAAIQRIMSSRGEWLNTLLQVIAVASLTVTMDMPSGMLVLWASNGAVTALQRYALSNDLVRRHVGLLTAEDIRHAQGPPVLQSTKTAVDAVRRELEYVQREVLSRFPNRSVDQRLMDEVNRVLKRERWSGRISMQLEAVIREDERDGKKYIAVVRKGTATA